MNPPPDHKSILWEGPELFSILLESTKDGAGVSRGGYSPNEDKAHQIIQDSAKESGLSVRVDSALNTWIDLPGAEGEEPRVLIGSHLDSVPNGGNYDGAAGVVAGLLALKILHASTDRPNRPISVIAFRAEEAAWFGTCYVGSRALLGTLTEDMLEGQSRLQGITLRQAMHSAGAVMEPIEKGQPLIDPATVHSFLELHIEQGPSLVSRNCPVGVVSGIRGNRRYPDVRWVGQGGHSGAVPQDLRRDALLGSVEWVSGLEEAWRAEESQGSDLVMTVGQFSTDREHGAVTRIPDKVNLSLDFRSLDIEVLERFDQHVQASAHSIAASRNLAVKLGAMIETAPASTSPALSAIIGQAIEILGLPVLEVSSGAGHDAAEFANADCDVGMIFVRNHGGSHNPAESMADDDFQIGVQVLVETIRRLTLS